MWPCLWQLFRSARLFAALTQSRIAVTSARRWSRRPSISAFLLAKSGRAGVLAGAAGAGVGVGVGVWAWAAAAKESPRAARRIDDFKEGSVKLRLPYNAADPPRRTGFASVHPVRGTIAGSGSAASTAALGACQPTMAPCAAIMASVAALNAGK